GWRTFLTNHVDGIAAIDLFVLPTITFRLLYCLVILRHGRRLWVSFGVTTNPTASGFRARSPRRFPGIVHLAIAVAAGSALRLRTCKCEDRNQGWARPSRSNCSDHSAGASRKFATPMPRASRPSTAGAGAMKAIDIVMLT